MIVRFSFIFLCVSLISACGGGSSPNVSPAYIATYESGQINGATVSSASRGDVNMQVYLPPAWNKDRAETYPVIFYLHGSGGNENSFFYNVDFEQLNTWIDEEVLEPFVFISIASYVKNGKEQQWYSSENEAFLTSSASTELRSFVLDNYNAGNKVLGESGKVSVQGYSLGASGTLHYGLKFPDKFSSAVANAFVSRYALENLKSLAFSNMTRILENDIQLRLTIGDKDAKDPNNRSTLPLHNYLDELSIPHEYQVLEDIPHSFYLIWNYIFSTTPTEKINGLHELQFHQSSW